MSADADFVTWTPPGSDRPITDHSGHPLTFGRVLRAHASLVSHASCLPLPDSLSGAHFDSDDDDAPCPCTWHPVLIDELACDLIDVQTWPGPWCGACWRSSCACGYTFDDLADAASAAPDGRLRCHACHASLPHADRA